MNEYTHLRRLFEGNRPPVAPRNSGKTLPRIALILRDALLETQESSLYGTPVLEDGEMDVLAIALTEMAEDLHAGLGIWQSLENEQKELFGTPLPLLWRPGDAPLLTFDARRFQFFLYTIWSYLDPECLLSPFHRELQAMAQTASEVLSKQFAGLARRSEIAAFLDSSNQYGWEVKRKLIWLGTHSYLLRFAFVAYAGDRLAVPPAVALVEDFICERTTAWSGLGATDLLAGILKLTEAERATLKIWNERHIAYYRVLSLQTKGRMIETMEVLNLINDQTYRIRVEREDCPFKVDQLLSGNLSPWRDEWYWSGEQQTFKASAVDAETIRQNFLEKNSNLAYRLRPDLVEKARAVVAEGYASFLKTYGTDLAIFPDGYSLAASEQKRMDREFVAKAGSGLAAIVRKYKLSRSGPTLNFPPEFLEQRDGIGVFYNPGQGPEYLPQINRLLACLRKEKGVLTEDERDMLFGLMRDPAVSPEFLRRLVRESGAAKIGQAFLIANFQESPDVEYLLRRCKGAAFRTRYPGIFFV